jgi:hypothetical protein
MGSIFTLYVSAAKMVGAFLMKKFRQRDIRMFFVG